MALSFLQHQDALLHLMGDFTGATRTKVKVWINAAYGVLWEQVYGLYKEQTDYFATTAAYESTSAITVTVTNGSTTVTSDGSTDTAFVAGMAGRFIQLNGTDPWYEIASITSATEIELSDAYLGDSDTECAFKLHTYRWALPSNVQRVIQVVAEIQETLVPLRMIDRTYVRSDWARPLEWDSGIPIYTWLEERDGDGNLYLAVWPPPTSSSLIQVRYQKEITDLSADTDTISIPGGDAALGALAKTEAMVYKGRNQQAQFYRQIYETELQRLLGTVVRSTGTTFRHKDRTSAGRGGGGLILGTEASDS